ncbi:hypothetical protein [Streptomyces reticuli]|uniref:hypothetical protein n=1 Tax=Streptomyces reticuli TaxID=1926 RepID=UPI000A896E0A
MYDAALAAHTNPRQAAEQLGARGLRPGWEMEWPAAAAGPWKSPYSWTSRSDFAL